MKHIIKVTSTIVAILLLMIMAGCAGSNNQNGAKTQEAQIPPTTKPIATEQPTKPPTEPPTIDPMTEKIAKLRSGYWCYYNGSNYMSAYTFGDEKLKDGKFVGHLIAYDVIGKTVKMIDAKDNNQMTNYEITEKAVLVTGEGGLVQTMTFSNDMSVLIETVDGKEKRYVHFDSIPNYDNLIAVFPTVSTNSQEYTAEDLMSMSMTEILDLLNNDITVEYGGQHSTFGSSVGMLCFYNFKKLPGFVFCPENTLNNSTQAELEAAKSDILAGKMNKLRFVAMMDGAKLNNKIASDMTYNQITSITNKYSTEPPAGQGAIRQTINGFCSGASEVSIIYETSNDAMQHMTGNGYDESYLSQVDPKIDYIIAYKS